MRSTQSKIEMLEGMLETNDLSDFDHGMVETLVRYLRTGKVGQLTDKQLAQMDRIFNAHFAG